MELTTRLLVGLLMLLAAAPEARPQTAQSGPPTRQVVVRKTGKFGNNGSSPAQGQSRALPGLCFQPGVGWQCMLTEQPGGPATRDTNTSMGLEERGSASGANPLSAYARLSNAKQAQSAECPEVLTDKKVLGAGGENFTAFMPGTSNLLGRRITTRSRPYRAIRLTIQMEARPRDGEDDAERHPPRPHRFCVRRSDRPHPRDQVGVRTFHAYPSSIKLRRLIRDAPDFRTRIKLQQLQTDPATQLPKARSMPETASGPVGHCGWRAAERLGGDQRVTIGRGTIPGHVFRLIGRSVRGDRIQ